MLVQEAGVVQGQALLQLGAVPCVDCCVLVCCQMALHGYAVSRGSFLSLLDQDGDGLLSVGEYMFFITLLAGTSTIVLAIAHPLVAGLPRYDYSYRLTRFRDCVSTVRDQSPASRLRWRSR